MKLLNRYRSLSLTARASVWFVFATLFQKGINIISIVVDAPNNTISALCGKLGMIPNITVKAIYTKA